MEPCLQLKISQLQAGLKPWTARSVFQRLINLLSYFDSHLNWSANFFLILRGHDAEDASYQTGSKSMQLSMRKRNLKNSMNSDINDLFKHQTVFFCFFFVFFCRDTNARMHPTNFHCNHSDYNVLKHVKCCGRSF